MISPQGHPLMFLKKLDQVGPAVVNGGMLGLKHGQVQPLQQRGDDSSTGRTNLQVVWPKLGCTWNITKAVAVWLDLGSAPWRQRKPSVRHKASCKKDQ